jgi:hypothetical protein
MALLQNETPKTWADVDYRQPLRLQGVLPGPVSEGEYESGRH